MYFHVRMMLKLGRKARGHFVTLIAIFMHLINLPAFLAIPVSDESWRSP